MKYETILLEKSHNIATITFNRPDKLNVMDALMQEELLAVLDDIASDAEVRVAIIAAKGKVFSAGVDIRERFLVPIEKRKKGELNPALLPTFTEVAVPKIMNLKKPLIASINGAAIGIGCTLSLACDIRILSENAKLGFGFVRIGVSPEFGSTYFLPRLVGIAKALELLYTGKTIDAHEAKEIGLANQVVAEDKLQDTTYALAQNIANAPPISIKMIREGIHQGSYTDISTALKWERFAFNCCLSTDDHEEGVMSFLEKRSPEFKGK